MAVFSQSNHWHPLLSPWPVVHNHVFVYAPPNGPNWAEQLTAWATLVVGLGFIATAVGAFLAARQLNETKKSRYSTLFMSMAAAWDEDDLIAVRRSLSGMTADQFKEHYFAAYKANSLEFYELLKLGNFFEYFGILVERDGLSLDLVEAVLGNSVIFYWNMWRKAIKEDDGNWPKFYENWKALAYEIASRPGHITLERD